MPENSPSGIQPFQQFLESVQAAEPGQYLQAAVTRIAHEGAFGDMRTHVLRYYEGVDVQHSFMDENGSIFDCIPMEQQPSLRHTREAIPKAPDLPRSPAETAAAATDERRPEHIPRSMPTARISTAT